MDVYLQPRLRRENESVLAMAKKRRTSFSAGQASKPVMG
jgi:hypothetical protein